MIDTGGRSAATRRLASGARHVVARPGCRRWCRRTPSRSAPTSASPPARSCCATPVFELIQYRPQTPTVARRPLVIVPPTINKFYILDLAPGRSMVEYLVGQGQQVFVVSWRNPDARHAQVGRRTPTCQAILDALDAACDITGSEAAQLMGSCSGGILPRMVLAHLAADRQAAPGRRRSRSLVTLLDQARGGHGGRAGRRDDRRGGDRGVARTRATWTGGRWPRCSPGCAPTT